MILSYQRMSWSLYFGMSRQFVPVVEEVKWERTTESRISTVIGMLPTSLQSRMSPLRQSRRTASLSNLKLSEDLVMSSPRGSPPQRLVSTVGLVSPVEDPEFGDRGGLDSCRMRDVPEKISRPREEQEGRSERPASGIKWKFAHQGAGLVSIAADAAGDGQSRDFERKAYVDALTYLLKGLPTDLDDREVERLQSALPGSCMPHNSQSLRSGTQTQDHRHDMPTCRSFIHRAVQAVVVNLLLFVHFILPYVVLLLKYAANLERKYKVSETLLAQGFNLFSAMGRQGTHIVEVLLKLDESGYGRSAQGAGVVKWLVEEVTRGVTDGVGEGLVMVRFKGSS